MTGDGSGVRLVVVLLGADRWPDWRDADIPAARDSHDQFRDYLRTDLQIPDSDVLDLFGSADQPAEQVGAIQDFLAQAREPAATDVLVYYVGHGDGSDDDKYALLTACANTARRGSSVLHASYVAEAIKEANAIAPIDRRMRAHVIVDACYAARAYGAFGRPPKGSVGVAVLASTNSGDKAITTEGRPTPFTEAMLAVLRRGEPEAERTISLTRLHELVTDELHAFADEDTVYPPPPYLSDAAIGKIGLFPNRAHEYRLDDVRAEGRRWCAVVSAADSASGNYFEKAVKGFDDLYRHELEENFRWHLATEKPETIYAEEVFRSPRSFQEKVAIVCAADLAFFDLTRHEPAVLVLLGVRAVIRRGVTICSVREGDTATAVPPFLLRDVNVVRHGPDLDPFPEENFGDRVLTGIRQLDRMPHRYCDLPAFDVMRQPLSDGEGKTIKTYTESVLVLCSFGDEYTAQNWRHVQHMLRRAIGRPKSELPVERTLDMGSPQLVSTNLFLAMRRNDLCICDLTEWKPNVLFELGLRLAANPLNPVCVIDKNGPAPARGLETLDQLADLRRVFGVIDYVTDDSDSFKPMIAAHVEMRRALDAQDTTWSAEKDKLPVGGIYRVAWRYADVAHEPSVASVFDLLQEQPFYLRDSLPYVFPAKHMLSGLTRESAVQRLVAAWLYAEHRLAGDGESVAGDVAKHARTVGNRLSELLAKSTDEADQALLRRIDEHLKRLNQVRSASLGDVPVEAIDHLRERLAEIRPSSREEVLATTTELKSQARNHRNRGMLQHAKAYLERSAELLEQAFGTGEDREADSSRRQVAGALSDTYGMLGGIERRLGDRPAALRAYRRGQTIEQDSAYGISDSYNLVNALAMTILVRPGDFPSLRGELDRALATVTAQVEGERRDQWWAWADYALLALLTGDSEAAAHGYRRFAGCGPTQSNYDSVREVLSELREPLASVDGAIASRIDHALADLDGHVLMR